MGPVQPQWPQLQMLRMTAGNRRPVATYVTYQPIWILTGINAPMLRHGALLVLLLTR